MNPQYHLPPHLPGSAKLLSAIPASRTRGRHFKALALALALGAGGAQAQTILEVGGAATIGDSVLTTNLGTALVPTVGSKWTAAGGNGNTFSSLISPAPAVVNSGAVTLTFTHRYNFESGWDGGAVFVSVNGAPFSKVPSFDFSSGSYSNTVTASVWPANEEVFTGTSLDWSLGSLITSVATLGNLTAGDTVAVEFRGGWDGNTNPPAPNWEIGTVNVSDTGATLLNADFAATGTSGFTPSVTGTGTSPWTYIKPVSRFELSATAGTADRYAPDIAGSVIDLNGANIEIVKIPGSGTLVAAQVFTLFDLTGGTTLTGTLGNITLPPGTWDTSNLAVNGTITVVAPPPVGIYEPFDYPAGLLAGKSGSSEYVLSGVWGANPNTTTNVIADSLFAAVARKGGSIDTTGGVNHYGGARSVPTSALAENGLLTDGATLWFSVDVGYGAGGNLTNSRLGFALANNKFSSTNFRYNIDDEGPQLGRGLGLTLGRFNIPGATNGVVAATLFRDGTTGTGFAGNVFGTLPTSAFFTGSSQHGLIVGKIIWGDPAALPTPTLDSIELYKPGVDLVLPGAPFSTLTNVDVDQSTFDTITFCWGDKVVLDEIRFGASYAAVTPPDVSAPEVASTLETGPLLQATFNEPVVIGTGNIRIIDPSGPTTLTTIAVTDSGQVSLSPNGRTLSILTTVLPVPGTTYYVEFDAGTVVDPFTNPLAANTGPALWSFTTESTAPVATITSPPAATPIYGTPTIPYTVSFNKFYMNDATVTAADFVNTGTASISVGTVTRVSAASALAVYSFDVTTSSPGTVQLQIAGPISDTLGNAFVAPFDDTDIYTLAAPSGEGARGNISLLNSAQGQDFGGTGNKTLAASFDASGANKLVVVIGGEHGFGGNTGGKFNSMTYNGQPMTLVIQEEVGIPTAAIFYLDNPAAFSPGAIVVNQENHNGSIFRAYALSGTAPGVGASNKSTTNPSSIGLITATSKSWIIGGVLNAGPNGGNGGTNMSAVLPLVESPLSDLESGSRWVSMCFGTGLVTTPNYGAYSFSGANSTDLLATVGVEIQAGEAIGYASWASTNSAGANLDLDHDGDGVQNGIEYLLGGPSGNTTGFTALPGVVDTAGTLSVTWPKGAGYAGVYGTDYLVETSDSLGTWVTETIGGGNITDSGTEVKFTFPGPLSGKNFARLKVTGP